MAERVAVHRIIHGQGQNRTVINPGERFDHKTVGISDADLEKFDRRGAVRMPRDETVAVPAATGPIMPQPGTERQEEPGNGENGANKRASSIDDL